MTENNENLNTEEETIKRPRGRPRLPEELKKPAYIPHPKQKKEKVVKPPREKRERNLEPREPLKKGRKKGQILKPERYLPDGTYNKKPLDREYAKKYYHEVIAHSGPRVCDICGSTLANIQGLGKHRKTQFCRRTQAFKSIPDMLPLVPETIHEDDTTDTNFNLVTSD